MRMNDTKSLLSPILHFNHFNSSNVIMESKGCSTSSNPSSNERYYVKDHSTHSYILPADEVEKERLNTLAGKVNALFDNNLIWAPVSLEDGDNVLDGGTGTGYWISSLANQVPSTTKLIGLDIETRMVPTTYPSNVSFKVGSVTSLPGEWASTFKLINQRLLVLALKEEQWKVVLNEIYRALIPGGWVQLCEPRLRIVSPSKEIENHPVMHLTRKIPLDIHGISIDIPDKLNGFLKEVGFVNVQEERRKFRLEVDENVRSTLSTFRGMKGVMDKENWIGVVDPEEDFERLFDDFVKKCEETPDTYFDVCAFVAQRPLA